VNEKQGADESSLGPEEESLVRLLRAGAQKTGDGVESVGEDSLTSYVLGTASQAQVDEVKNSLLRSPGLRQRVLQMMQTAGVPSSEGERASFEEAVPPPLMSVPTLAALAREMEHAPPDTRVKAKPPSGRAWLEWMLGGWAVAATAAAGTMLVFVLHPAPAPVATAPKPGGLEPSISHLTLDVVPTVSLGGSSRGGGSPDNGFRVAATARSLQLRVDPPDVDDGSSVRVTILGPDGGQLIQETLPVGEVWGSALILHSKTGFEPGRYVLRMEGERESHPETVTIPFHLHR
jgi:hypothetical protein